MLARLKALFKRHQHEPKAAPMLDDIPPHKGFIARAALPSGLSMTAHFSTLKAAQIWIAQRKDFAAQWARHMGRAIPCARFYSIRNLETGRFAPYRWNVTRAEIVNA